MTLKQYFYTAIVTALADGAATPTSPCVLSTGAVTRENRHMLFCSGSARRLESRSYHVAAHWAHAKTREAGRPEEPGNI